MSQSSVQIVKPYNATKLWIYQTRLTVQRFSLWTELQPTRPITVDNQKLSSSKPAD